MLLLLNQKKMRKVTKILILILFPFLGFLWVNVFSYNEYNKNQTIIIKKDNSSREYIIKFLKEKERKEFKNVVLLQENRLEHDFCIIQNNEATCYEKKEIMWLKEFFWILLCFFKYVGIFFLLLLARIPFTRR